MKAAASPAISQQPTASSTDVATEKENLPEDSMSKKPRLFARPAYKSPAVLGSGAGPATAKPAPTVAVASDPAPARIFSVLYCKRDKFKVLLWSSSSSIQCHALLFGPTMNSQHRCHQSASGAKLKLWLWLAQAAACHVLTS
jgi:hypothetical protein